MSNNVWLVLKAAFAVFINGFAGGALLALGQWTMGSPVDWKSVASAGFITGIIGLLNYLKSPPLEAKQVTPSNSTGPYRNGLSLLVAGLLALSALSLSACGNERTLAKVGYDINVGINSTAHVVIDLHNQAVIFKNDDTGYRSFLLLIQTSQQAADDLNKELDKLATLDATHVDEVLTYVDKLATQLVLARQIAGKNLPPQVVNAIAIGQAALNGARIVIAAYKPSSTAPAKKPQALAKIKYTPVEVLAN